MFERQHIIPEDKAHAPVRETLTEFPKQLVSSKGIRDVAVSEKFLYAVDSDNCIRSFDRESGQMHWRNSPDSNVAPRVCIAVHRGLIYFMQSGQIQVFDEELGKKYAAFGSGFSGRPFELVMDIAVDDSYVYVLISRMDAAGQQCVQIFDANTCYEFVKEIDLQSSVMFSQGSANVGDFSSMAVSNGCIYFCDWRTRRIITGTLDMLAGKLSRINTFSCPDDNFIPHDISIEGRKIYVADFHGRIRVFVVDDIDSRATPELQVAATYLSEGQPEPTAVTVLNGRMFVSNTASLIVREYQI